MWLIVEQQIQEHIYELEESDLYIVHQQEQIVFSTVTIHYGVLLSTDFCLYMSKCENIER